MPLYKTGWIIIALEIVLLLIWIYSAFFSKNGTDAAGRGMATIYLLALGAYIVVGIILMLINNRYCTMIVILMAALPLLIIGYGLVRKFL
jgi:hypothetical protein